VTSPIANPAAHSTAAALSELCDTATMRGDIVFGVYGTHEGRSQDSCFGAFRTRVAAEAHAQQLVARTMHGENWAQRYHNRGFVIRELLVDTDFEIPSLPKPRDKWAVELVAKPAPSDAPETWPTVDVKVFRRDAQGLTPVAAYHRNHTMFVTFEPFRQRGRDFALISRNYVTTAVLDLATGEIVAEEPIEDGFCPAGFYVPDWWDVNDGTVIPGSEYWSADNEWPCGDVGFVWGCHWGDDTSWKVQHLDLSRISEGIIMRTERYGYVPIAVHGWTPPWLDLERAHDAPRSPPPPFLRVARHACVAEVSIVTTARFNLDSGVRVSNDD